MKILLIVIAVIIIYMFIKNNTTPKNLGVINGKLSPMPNKPNAVSSQSSDSEKYVDPLDFKGNLEDSKKIITAIVNDYNGANIKKNDTNYIYAVFTTGKMKFHDDVEFYFDEKNKKIHFRSSSRVGYSDMGMNRKRYDELKENYYSK